MLMQAPPWPTPWSNAQLFAVGLLIGTILTLGVVEVELPDCDNTNERAAYRLMSSSLAETSEGLERIGAILEQWER